MPLFRSFAISSVLIGLSLAGFPAAAEMTGSLNINGTTGLIDMPSGDAQDDATFAFSASVVGPVTRGTISFQITPRLSAAFRFQKWSNWNTLFPAEGDTFDDRSMDLRYQLLQETRYLPSLTIGLQDFTGRGLFSSEYIAATKTVSDTVKLTAGVGWGRLGTYGGSTAPFGARPPLGTGDAGTPNSHQWFRGDAAAFGGIEYKINDRWTFKAEYSSDAYLLETEERGILERSSPYNFGLEYQKGPSARYGVYSMHGTEIGLVFHMILDPKKRATGGVMGASPVPVKLRPARSVDPEAYDGQWVEQATAGPILRDNLAKRLAIDGIVVQDIAYSSGVVQVRIRNNRIDAGAQAIGRTARALSHVMPASVQIFEIVPVVNGVGASKVTIRRSDLEELEFAADNASLLRSQIAISDAGPLPDSAVGNDELYPKFSWSLKPALRISEPLRGDVGLRLSANYDVRPGLVLSGSIYKRLFGNADRSGDPSSSVLPHVRSDGSRYSRFGDPALERLTLAWYARPAKNIYSRVTLGYLERMHAGISGELLWKPVESSLALGVELNYSRQRDTDGGFGFGEYDYGIMTGHLSAYYDFGNGFVGKLDVGKYLAGDVGGTISVDRVFANGWRVGAFATLTDVSSADFGEGGFDKGVRFSIPINWALGQQTKGGFGSTLRPANGDGGARLEVDGRLYDSIRDYHSDALDRGWGRVWR